MLNSYNRIFLKFLISAFILALASRANSQPINHDTLHQVTSQLSDLIFPLFIVLAVMIVTKIIFNLFMTSHPPEYHLTREKFEQSLKQSKDALASIQDKTPQSTIFVENKEINTLISKIINKSKDLLNDSDLQGKDRHITEKSVSHYMPKVIDSYKNITPSMRNIKGNNQISAHEMTVDQLELIFKGLEEIELSLLSQKHDNLKVSGKFLNQVFYQDKEIKDLEI